MAWAYLVLLIVVDLCGLVLCAFTLPGTWLMLIGAAVYAAMTRGHYLGWKTLLALFVLALTAEVGEFVLGGAGAKKAGASKWGIFGALVGAVLGGIFLQGLVPIPILGAVVGICLGSFAGAFAVELFLGRPVWQSVRIGFGAAKGRFMGIVGKVTIGFTMFVLSVYFALPLPSRWRPPPRPTTVPTTRPTTAATTTAATNAATVPAPLR
jgi:uncharacterized protein YqgC (DUF456 family)